MEMGVGIVGAGLIGRKRADAVEEVNGTLVAVADKQLDRAKELARIFDAEPHDDWRDLVKRNDIQLVIISTTNDVLSECACAALELGKHVLIEKPGGRSVAELKKVAATAKKADRIARIGFNHRFHPAIWQAKTLVANGEIGEILYFRARYGHGGRIGYEKEWRADPAISGGGELIDQGVHLIDLCRWMGGEFDLEFGKVDTLFWKMPVDDNAFLFLKGRDERRYAWLHASSTEWKNLFDFEVYGTTGKIEVEGLGGSYGDEMLRIVRVDRVRGAPKVETESFAGTDSSWRQELKALKGELAGRSSAIATIDDGIRALEIVEATYIASSGARGSASIGITTDNIAHLPAAAKKRRAR